MGPRLGAIYEPVTFLSGFGGRDSVPLLFKPVVALEPVTVVSSFDRLDCTNLYSRIHNNSGAGISSVSLVTLIFRFGNKAPSFEAVCSRHNNGTPVFRREINTINPESQRTTSC